MGGCDCCIPKKFLCRFSLKIGTVVVGIFMFCVMLASTIVFLVEAISTVVYHSEDLNYNVYPWKHVFSFSVVACIDCFLMMMINVWLLWAVRKKKTSILLCWVVTTAVWLVQTVVLLAILLVMYSADVNLIAWLICVTFAMVGVGIVIYGFLVVYAYWLKLKNSTAPVSV